MRVPATLLLFCFLCSSIPLSAQQRVSPRNLYERVLCVVPMIGKGTFDDPRRPLFAPNPTERGMNRSQPRIIGFSYQVSDNGEFALVEFVARDKKALEPILSDKRPNVKVFRKGRATRQQIESEFLKHKKDFDWNRFGVIAR